MRLFCLSPMPPTGAFRRRPALIVFYVPLPAMQRALACLALTLFLLSGMSRCRPETPADAAEMTDDAALLERARALAQRFMIVDGHIDVPYRMTEYEPGILGGNALRVWAGVEEVARGL